MAVIQPKHRPKIQKGQGLAYNPETFLKEHKVANFYTVDDPQEILDRIRPMEFEGMRLISFDSETHPYFRTSQDLPQHIVRRWVGTGKKATPQDYPFELSVCDGVNAFAIFDSVENNFEKFKQLAPLFEDETIDKAAHNTKFDMHMFANIGMRIKGRLHDTVVLAKLANENRTSFMLRDLAAKLPHGIDKFEWIVDSYKQLNKVTDYRQIPQPLLSEYANADVWNCFDLFMTEYPILIKDELVDLYNNEMELMICLYEMERRGMRTDSDYKEPVQSELQKLTDEAESAIYAEAGKVFNINSGKQLYDVLIALGTQDKWINRTDKGNPMLGGDELERLAIKHDITIVNQILEYRKYSKLLTTYAIGIYDQADSEGKVHSSINQTEATTGRMSITKPALQTLPKKDKRIRKAFIPEDDYELWFMDLDQVEYRGFAHYAQIPTLLEAIKNGHDVHAATAADIFHQDFETFIQKYAAGDKEADDLRSKGKTLNFSLIYGVGKDKLALDLRCTVTEAEQIKAAYFAKMPEARTFIATVHQVIKYRGYVKNFYGRRRRLKPDDCYKAPNALIQGWAADYIKHKMLQMYKYIKHYNLKTQLINIVHDEVVVLLHKDEREHLPYLRWLLSDFTTFRCPITAGAEMGNPSWGEKVTPDDEIGFKEPEDKSYLEYNVFNGGIFDAV